MFSSRVKSGVKKFGCLIFHSCPTTEPAPILAHTLLKVNQTITRGLVSGWVDFLFPRVFIEPLATLTDTLGTVGSNVFQVWFTLVLPCSLAFWSN